jgi:hypothetical protein
MKLTTEQKKYIKYGAIGLLAYKLLFGNTSIIPVINPISPIPAKPTNKYSFGAQQYLDFANTLHDSMKEWGTDETQIRNVLLKMKTFDDVLALIDSYGKRTLLTPFRTETKSMTLSQAFNYELDEDDIETYVNTPLKKTGYKF